MVEKYVSRISGPLLDRMDLHVEVPSVEFDAMRRREQPEPSSAVKARVDAARARQAARFAASMGWRRTSRASRLNSGSSSRKSTPLWAREISPGLGRYGGEAPPLRL